MILSWVAMLSWTLVKQRLKLPVWLQTKDESLADLSHLLSVSYATGREASDPEDRDCLAILMKELLSFASSLGRSKLSFLRTDHTPSEYEEP